MNDQKTPQAKKALDYTHQRVSYRGVNNNKSSRKAWPFVKTRRNRQYRHAVRRLVDLATVTPNPDDDPLRTVPVRRRRDWNWDAGVSLGEWLEARRQRQAWQREQPK
jgi:hypothetical protein